MKKEKGIACQRRTNTTRCGQNTARTAGSRKVVLGKQIRRIKSHTREKASRYRRREKYKMYSYSLFVTLYLPLL
ncbi:hypothetical protein L873DRAFT_238479 [Choiromyces venosus 120613-1]|uniref:Uncharacterized protein n=1 Tax=Choiromyces venosus 120613-1 TaxID=1336337 RepID=A0A3N4JEA4_9PEZI|nr:hypothetical protein L873DRAFT_238479 [Choiromyces venosus 120613-1]